MAKKKNVEISEEERQKLIDLPPEEKLARLKYLEIEVEKTKANIKDQKASAREYINEMEARRHILMEAVTQEPVPN